MASHTQRDSKIKQIKSFEGSRGGPLGVTIPLIKAFNKDPIDNNRGTPVYRYPCRGSAAMAESFLEFWPGPLSVGGALRLSFLIHMALMKNQMNKKIHC